MCARRIAEDRRSNSLPARGAVASTSSTNASDLLKLLILLSESQTTPTWLPFRPGTVLRWPETCGTPARVLTRYTWQRVNRRFVLFLVMLALGLQGPSLAYTASMAKFAPAPCAGYTLGHGGAHDASSCSPQGAAPGLCCAGGVVLSGIPSAIITTPSIPVQVRPPASASVALATERPAPLLRPPIS